jgi:hypothetical protein
MNAIDPMIRHLRAHLRRRDRLDLWRSQAARAYARHHERPMTDYQVSERLGWTIAYDRPDRA